MKFTISSSAFSNRLSVASKVLLSKNTMPILDCFLIDVKNGHVNITASDGEKFFVTKVPLIDSDNNGRFCVTAKYLIDSIKELAEQPLTFEFNPDSLEIRGIHQTGFFSLVGQDADTYPVQHLIEGENATSLTLNSDVLLKGINLCINATAEEELRQVMTCIYMDIKEDKITFAATDGRKLVRYINKENSPGITAGLIIPKKVAMVAKNTIDGDTDITLSFDGDKAQIHTEDIDFLFRKVEGNYLNYNAVIPTSNPYCATVDRSSLLGAMRRVSVFSNQSNGLTKLHIDNGQMKLTVQNVDYMTNAEDNVMCEYSNTPISIGFNCFYMIDVISVIDAESISIQLADPSRPALITPTDEAENEETTMLVMPMMLNE